MLISKNLVDWLLDAGVSFKVSDDKKNIELSEADTLRLESGVLIGDLIEDFQPESLSSMLIDGSDHSRIYNWKTVFQWLEDRGHKVDEETKNLVLNSDTDIIIELFSHVFSFISNGSLKPPKNNYSEPKRPPRSGYLSRFLNQHPSAPTQTDKNIKNNSHEENETRRQQEDCDDVSYTSSALPSIPSSVQETSSTTSDQGYFVEERSFVSLPERKLESKNSSTYNDRKDTEWNNHNRDGIVSAISEPTQRNYEQDHKSKANMSELRKKREEELKRIRNKRAEKTKEEEKRKEEQRQKEERRKRLYKARMQKLLEKRKQREAQKETDPPKGENQDNQLKPKKKRGRSADPPLNRFPQRFRSTSKHLPDPQNDRDNSSSPKNLGTPPLSDEENRMEFYRMKRKQLEMKKHEEEQQKALEEKRKEIERRKRKAKLEKELEEYREQKKKEEERKKQLELEEERQKREEMIKKRQAEKKRRDETKRKIQEYKQRVEEEHRKKMQEARERERELEEERRRSVREYLERKKQQQNKDEKRNPKN